MSMWYKVCIGDERHGQCIMLTWIYGAPCVLTSMQSSKVESLEFFSITLNLLRQDLSLNLELANSGSLEKPGCSRTPCVHFLRVGMSDSATLPARLSHGCWESEL